MLDWKEMLFGGVPEPEKGGGRGKEVAREIGKRTLESLFSGAPEEDYLVREGIRKKHRLEEVAEDEERRQVKRRERKKKRRERKEKGMEVAGVLARGVLGLATGGLKGAAKAMLSGRRRRSLPFSGGDEGGVVIEGKLKEED